MEKINQSLEILISLVEQLNNSFQRRYRFTKLNAKGEILPEEATKWAAVKDNETGLIWEINTNQQKYSPDKIADYVNTINQQGLAGYKDWRVPSLDELKSLAGFDKGYFPQIKTGVYYSSTPSETDELWCLSFDSGRSFYGVAKAHLLLVR